MSSLAAVPLRRRSFKRILAMHEINSTQHSGLRIGYAERISRYFKPVREAGPRHTRRP